MKYAVRVTRKEDNPGIQVRIKEMNNHYSKEDRLRVIIADNPQVLMAMSRFGISLGFGEKSVQEICSEQNVDCNTFLAVINFITYGETDCEKISPESLIHYLDNAHSYFLDFCLPMIRRKLIDAIGLSSKNQLSLLILKFYDEYVEEVRNHMEYESREVFEYVRNLLQGRKEEKFSIDVFAAHHHSIHDKLKELKDILIRYLPQQDSNMLNSVLFDIINCEQDLMMHCRVEDQLFVPSVRKLESNMNLATEERSETSASKDEEDREDVISDRERDIIECVARGMSNKEIADKLFISVNTVTTHRRNIAQKLQIHSPAGLAIYAVINGIVKIDELRQ